jgi:AcrR family transcriptional regulator
MAARVPYAERRKTQLREEIVDAAFAEFAERGYHQAGIAEIAERLGIGHGTFYRHFENKRAILDHVVDDVMARALEALAAENAPDATDNLQEYREQVDRIVDALHALVNDDPRVVRMLLVQAGGIDADIEAKVFGLLDSAAQITAAYLKNGRDQGFLRPDVDCQATAEALVGMIIGGSLFALRKPDDRGAQERYKRAAVTLMFEGIAKQRG